MENEPNFKESNLRQITAIERFTTVSPKTKRTQTDPNKANPKPIQSQYEPNFRHLFRGKKLFARTYNLSSRRKNAYQASNPITNVYFGAYIL